MKYLKSWKLFEFKETESNTPVLYKDDNLEVKVVKTFDACKEQGKDTSWCSNNLSLFYKHNMTSNMFRFNFKDGYKLRLTWDYINRKASRDTFAGGTHWGSGGKVNGKQIYYDYIRPEDESEPFLFDYHKNDERQEMVNRINSIPQEAIDVVHDYQNKSSKEKSALVNNLYNEVSKIKVLDVDIIDDDYPISAKINYNGNIYKIAMDQFGFTNYPNDFRKDFKNKYAFSDDYRVLQKYMFDKVNSILKSKKLNESLQVDIVNDILLEISDIPFFDTKTFKDYDATPDKKDMLVVIIKRDKNTIDEDQDNDSIPIPIEVKETIKRLLDYITSEGSEYRMEIGTDNQPPGSKWEDHVREFKYEELDDDLDMWQDEWIRIEINLI